jgi:hypothetical protein
MVWADSRLHVLKPAPAVRALAVGEALCADKI